MPTTHSEVFGKILANLCGFNLIEAVPKFGIDSCPRLADRNIYRRMDDGASQHIINHVNAVQVWHQHVGQN